MKYLGALVLMLIIVSSTRAEETVVKVGDFYPWGINCPVAVIYNDNSYCCAGEIEYPFPRSAIMTLSSCKTTDIKEIRLSLKEK